MGEFFLPYEQVRTTENPTELVLDFLQTTYVAAADLADWNRSQLERAQPAST